MDKPIETQKNQRILIVDDNPLNLQVLGIMLQEKNYEIEFATNGISALDWMKTEEFDLVLLDINMPQMDGFQVCKAMRADKSLDRIPVIFLSADSDREIIFNGFDIGAQDYITKPFDNRELLVKVNTLLSLKKALEKIDRLEKGTD
jgi:DNA-binding response OmpR family regulator